MSDVYASTILTDGAAFRTALRTVGGFVQVDLLPFLVRTTPDPFKSHSTLDADANPNRLRFMIMSLIGPRERGRPLEMIRNNLACPLYRDGRATSPS